MLIKNEFIDPKKLLAELQEFQKVIACEPHGTTKALWANLLGQYKVQQGWRVVWEGTDLEKAIQVYEDIEIILKPNSAQKL